MNRHCKRANSRTKGFTYLEVGVVIGLLLLGAALIVPNVFVLQESRKLKLFKQQAQAAGIRARSWSVESGDKVLLTFDKASNAIQLLDLATNGSRTMLSDVKLPDGVTTTSFTADQGESPSDNWEVPFYPDGVTAGGGIEFKNRDQAFSLIIERGTGPIEVADGPVPDLSTNSWPAGSYAKRT